MNHLVTPMSQRHLLGRYEDEQIRAAKILLGRGPLAYRELRQELEIEDRSVMQAIMRGLSDNGLVRSYVDGEGRRKYDALNEDKIEQLTDR